MDEVLIGALIGLLLFAGLIYLLVEIQRSECAGISELFNGTDHYYRSVNNQICYIQLANGTVIEK